MYSLIVTIDSEKQLYKNAQGSWSFDYVVQRSRVMAIWLKEHGHAIPTSYRVQSPLKGTQQGWEAWNEIEAIVQFHCMLEHKVCEVLLHPQLIMLEGCYVAMYWASGKASDGIVMLRGKHAPFFQLVKPGNKRGTMMWPWKMAQRVDVLHMM